MTNLQNRIPVAVLGATSMLGQRFLALADLFGLTLLVSLKKQAHTTAGDQLVPEPHATTSLKERVGTSS